MVCLVFMACFAHASVKRTPSLIDGNYVAIFDPVAAFPKLSLPAAVSVTSSNGTVVIRGLGATNSFLVSGPLLGDSTFTATQPWTRCSGVFSDNDSIEVLMIFCHNIAGIQYALAFDRKKIG